MEIVNYQLEDYGNKTKSQEINKITDRSNQAHRKGEKYQKKCGRCGSNRHGSQDENCPAKEKKCHKCDKTGHFRQYCKTRLTQKRKYDNQSNQENERQNKQKTRSKNESEAYCVEEEVDYVFHIDDDKSLVYKVGGVNIEMLIDSGCKLDLITDRTSVILKDKKVKVFNQNSKPNKTSYAHGSKIPLTVKGSFETEVEINGEKLTSTIYVIAGGTRNVLGKNTQNWYWGKSY